METSPQAKISVPVYCLVVIYGLGTWVAINAVFSELPLLVSHMPEKWDLPAYLVVIIQLANVGPLCYGLLGKFVTARSKEAIGSYVLLAMGVAASLMLAFLWKRTATVGGKEHSVALFVLVFILAVGCCTSSVVFLPYMSRFASAYVTAFFIGNGLSGLVPSLLSLVQGAGDFQCLNKTTPIQNVSTANSSTDHAKGGMVPVYTQPRFSVAWFFVFLALSLATCALAFALLNHLEYCKRHWVMLGETAHNQPNCDVEVKSGDSSPENAPSSPKPDIHLLHKPDSENPCPQHYNTQPTDASVTVREPSLCSPDFALLLTFVALLNGFGNSILPSIQTYAALPYRMLAYNLSTRLGIAVAPLACFTAFFVIVKSRVALALLNLLVCILVAVFLALAALSPNPPLAKTDAGIAIVVILSIMLQCLIAFAKVTVATLLQQQGHRQLFWCGAATQIGSAAGALIAFLLVTVFKVFSSVHQCQADS